jgi:hypothetical protein
MQHKLIVLPGINHSFKCLKRMADKCTPAGEGQNSKKATSMAKLRWPRFDTKLQGFGGKGNQAEQS